MADTTIVTESKTYTFFKQHWLSLLIVIGIIILFFARNPFGCNKPSEPTIVTTHDTVTAMIPQPPVTIPQYVPYPVMSQLQPLPANYQTLPSEVSKLQQMITELANKYYVANTYRDSIPLHDSVGRRVGVVNLEDVVSENQIKNRKPSYQLTLPTTTITNTTTITYPYVPKRQLYIGAEALGNTTQFLNGAGIGLLYKNKKDQIFVIKADGVLVNKGIQPEYGFGMYYKIGKKNN